MQSPPKTFGTPTKRHKKNDYNPYLTQYTSTENPSINYSSPPRKTNRHKNALSVPHNHRGYNLSSSPISSRYTNRIGTSLYNDQDNANCTSTPLRYSISHRKRKYLSSPISPTFHPINSYHSPSKQQQNLESASCDRYTPTRGDINRYDIHSPTKRFVHNNHKNMMSYTNIIRPSRRKRRKLGQNYSGTNDDPSSLNHRLKLKLSQHAYNQVLQSELLGFSAEYSNVVNQVFNSDNNEDDTQKNDNISAIQIRNDADDDADNDGDEHKEYDEDNNETNNESLTIYGSPSLPNRRMNIGHFSPNNGNNLMNIDNKKKKKKNHTMYNNVSHHPLCPCFNHNNNNHTNNNQDNDDDSASDCSDDNVDDDGYNTDNGYNSDNCVCDSITSNIATNFLMSPQRTLRYSRCKENAENNDNENAIQMTPISKPSQSVLTGSRKCMRNIAKSPFKVLDAPRLMDDFYLNLVDWSSSCNILSVGLGECVYLWSAHTSKVTKLVDLTQLFEDTSYITDCDECLDGYDMVTAVGWSLNHEYEYSNLSGACSSNTNGGSDSCNGTNAGDYLAVGSGSGYVFVFDSVKSKLCRGALRKHNHRVGVIAWRDNDILCSGSRDRNIYLRDIRIADNASDITHKLLFHKQEVCGLKWSQDSLYLASGGNDNKLAIWDIRHSVRPLCFGKHKAAVKAITWSPHDSALIASGGGTADRCIKFWNINNFISTNNQKPIRSRPLKNKNNPIGLKPIQVIDTGSQVCNLLWSKNVNEIVSTHGYSLNQIVVWKYPSMDKIVTLTGHTYRVLYLAGSPDGQTVVTGAGDETLRLWNIFPPANTTGNNTNNMHHQFIPKPYSIPLHIR